MRWTGVALIASLALNGLLIGFLIGDLSRPIRTVSGLRDFTGHYPEEIQRALRREVIRNRATILPGIRALNEERLMLIAEMRRADADPAELGERMARIRALTTEIQTRLQDATRKAVLDQPPEVRARIGTPETVGGALE